MDKKTEQDFKECLELLYTLTLAAEHHDTTALDQTASVTRAFLEKHNYGE